MSGTLENSFLFHVDDFTTLFNSSRCQQTFCVSFSFYSPLFFLIAVIFSRNLSRDFFFFRIVLLKVIFNYYFFLNCILKIFFREKFVLYIYNIFFSMCSNKNNTLHASVRLISFLWEYRSKVKSIWFFNRLVHSDFLKARFIGFSLDFD